MSRGETATAGGPTVRGTEARLLLLALVVVLGAYALVVLAQVGEITRATVVYSVALASLALLAHAAIRRFAPLADPVLLPTVFLLNGFGLVLIRRLDFANGTDLAVAQTTWTVTGVGLFALTLIAVSSHRQLTRYGYTAGLVAIALLLLPLIPGFGDEVRGARLWVRAGPLSFQPGEIAKLALVVFLAGYLDRKRALLSVATTRVGPLLVPPARHLAPVVVAAIGGIGILVAQRDLGSSLLFFGVFVTMLYIATGRAAYPTIGFAVFVVGGAIAYTAFDHVQRRFAIWLDPWQDVQGAGYQIAQSLFGLGTGGLTGTGLGFGHPDVPAAATDAIFAVLGEELGLLGATAILIAFLIVVMRGYKIALTAPDEEGSLLAAGFATIIALQVFVIIGGITRLVPLTGITLPFVSYGGSSLISNYLLLALLVRLSDTGRRQARVGSGERR
ncbi:MAG: FtsW/RodA/SpoVE family cell cycle protein [Nitriliruptorales bacterium]